MLFDLDGTLLNRDASLKVFIENQYERFKHLLDHVPKESYIDRFIILDHRGYIWKDKVYQQLVDEFKITGLTWQELLQDYIGEFKVSCVPFENLISTLEKLKDKNIALGMITNGKGQFQIDNIKELGIEEYFETILISEWEQMKKPNSEIFLKALDKLNVQPSQSIFVGDHPINDVQAAQNIGMTGIWKKDSQWDNVQADYIIEDLAEILSIVEK